MSGPGIGTYVIAILNDDGTLTQPEIERTSQAGCPSVREEIEIDDVLYRVLHVRHSEQPRRTRRVYTTPRVFVRIVKRGRLH